MRPPDRSSWSDRSMLGWVVATNALPVIGVLVWKWNLATLVLVYWLETAVVFLWSLVLALFAERPPETSATPFAGDSPRERDASAVIPVPRTAVAVQLRNLPSVAVAGVGFGLCWLLLGLLTLETTLETSATAELTGGTLRRGRIVGLWLFVSNGGAMATDYFRNRRYRTQSPQQVIRTGVVPILVLGLAIMFFGAFAEGAESGLPILGALVGGKLSVDLLRTFRDRIRAFDERTGGWLGLADEEEKEPSE